MNWHPIETAPKDGTVILGWQKEWGDAALTIVWVDSRGGYWGLAGCSSLDLGDNGQPTHWYSVPETP